jgi:hypothetical protein
MQNAMLFLGAKIDWLDLYKYKMMKVFHIDFQGSDLMYDISVEGPVTVLEKFSATKKGSYRDK